MSEYQYYEFQAIDRPLTAREMGELRSYSTRARITATSFVNDYSWGGFKGNVDEWMDKYFDAFLYFANWGTRILKLRLSTRLLDLATAREYCEGGGVSVREASGRIILSFVSQDEESGDWGENEGLLASLVPVRAELARGDLRALYLGWLLQVQAGELDDDATEPPVPPGLGELSVSLESLAEFLRIDGDLLHVAAEASPSMEECRIDRREVRSWVGGLPDGEKDDFLADLVADGDPALIAELIQRYLKDRSADRGNPATARRTVGRLCKAAEAFATVRRRIEAEKRAQEKAQREREAAIARQKHLDRMAGREDELWAEVGSLVARRQPKNYDQAVRILIDLRDLAARGAGGDFGSRIEALRQAQAKKPSFIERLRKAGL